MPIMHIPPRAIVTGGLIPRPPHRLFHVAPNASGGDGSAERPWPAAEVLGGSPERAFIGSQIKGWSNALGTSLPAGNASSPIQPGDGIVLMPGDYGDLMIQGDYSQDGPVGCDNLSGIHGDGTPGAPVGHIWLSSHDGATLRTLSLSGGVGWVFAGLTLRADLGSGDTNQALVYFRNRHRDCVLYGCDLGMASDPAVLTAEEFLARAPNGVKDYGGRAPGDPDMPGFISIVGNRLRNVGNGVGTQRSRGVLIADNDIGWMAYDGVDHGSWNVVIRGNRIHDRIDVGQSYHPDGIQLQPYGQQGSTDNPDDILVEGNEILAATWPLPYQSMSEHNVMQGISQFDGEPTNYRVIGNRICTCATQGISIYGARGVRIEGNSVCLNGYPNNGLLGIVVMKAKEGPAAGDIEIMGNVSHSIGVDETAENWRAQDNLIIQQQVGQAAALSYFKDGVKQWIYQPGEYPQATITDQKPADVFVEFETPMGPYDWRRA